jgi:hypothetical protein
MLGGLLARKDDGEPCVKTIWIGLQRVMDCAVVLQFIREAAPGRVVYKDMLLILTLTAISATT